MGTVGTLTGWRQWARGLKRDTFALYLACRDPRVPWYAKLLAAGVAAYAFSPIDLIPDFVPVLGYLDDLVLVPLGIALALRMIPPEVMAECRLRADEALAGTGSRKPRNWVAGGVIVGLWILALLLVAFAVARVVAAL